MNGERLQVMHNGVRIIEGCYYGAWMTEIIRQLKGHHEPQEELAFHLIVERLRNDTQRPVMLELGAFWSYYSLWFLDRNPTGTSFLIEPDPNNLEVGRRNFALNGRVGTFLQAAIGANPAPPSPFRCESDGVNRLISTESLPSLFARFGLKRADMVLADIQGYETAMLEGAAKLLTDKCVRFLVISTHHHSISGDPITHQRCLEFLKSHGAHIIAEHSVPESYSGDGLIAASFDVRDQDLVARISYARARESLFGETEVDLARISVGDPIGSLLALYYLRDDLRRAFPEVRNGDYLRLICWAVSKHEQKHEPYLNVIANESILERYREWYMNDPWNEVNRLKSELEQIRKSATFRTLRRISRVVDTLFPDGTLRGRFRRMVIGRLQSKAS